MKRLISLVLVAALSFFSFMVYAEDEFLLLFSLYVCFSLFRFLLYLIPIRTPLQ